MNLGVECKIKLNVSPFGHGIEGLGLELTSVGCKSVRICPFHIHSLV